MAVGAEGFFALVSIVPVVPTSVLSWVEPGLVRRWVGPFMGCGLGEGEGRGGAGLRGWGCEHGAPGWVGPFRDLCGLLPLWLARSGFRCFLLSHLPATVRKAWPHGLSP